VKKRQRDLNLNNDESIEYERIDSKKIRSEKKMLCDIPFMGLAQLFVDK